MKSIPNNPASTCSPFARNGGIQPSAAAERQNAAQTPPSEAVPVGLRSSGRPKAGRTSITKRVKTALATALLTGLTTVLYAAPPTITARVEPDSIGIGDRFDVVIDVDRDLVQVVEFPTFNPPPQSGLEVVESHPVDTLRRDGRHLSLRKRYTLAAFEEGNLGLGRAQVLYLDKNITDTLYTADTLRLQVGTFQIDSTSHTIYDIKAQRTLPFRYGEISGYVLWSLLGLIVLGGAIYAGRRLMARYARKVRDIFRPAPPLPPLLDRLSTKSNTPRSSLCVPPPARRVRALWSRGSRQAIGPFSGLEWIAGCPATGFICLSGILFRFHQEKASGR